MAKKTAAALPAATPAVPKKTKQSYPSLPCPLVYFWPYALKAWRNCKDKLPRFAAEGGSRYTEAFVDEQLAYIQQVKAMPNNRSRNAPLREVKQSLAAARQSVADWASRLNKAIEYTYKDPSQVDVQRSAAGLTAFAKTKDSDWAGVSSFVGTANAYLSTNLSRLVDAGAANVDFATNFEAMGLAFDNLWGELQAKRQWAKSGTKDVAAGIARILEELNPMLGDAAIFFKYEPALKELFVQELLIREVRNGHPATVSGGVTQPASSPDGKVGEPLAGVLVEVLGASGKSVLTNKKGRYKIQLAGGDFTLRFSGTGLRPVERAIQLEPGRGRRLNLVLEPAPAPVPLSVTAPASMNEVLNKAVLEVTATDGNGLPAPQPDLAALG